MPPSLVRLDLSGGYGDENHHKFTGGIPTEWGSLTNLKELNMGRCGLSGARFDSRTRSARHTHERKRENPGSEEPGNEERAGNESKCP